jgi:hypothetical protein
VHRGPWVALVAALLASGCLDPEVENDVDAASEATDGLPSPTSTTDPALPDASPAAWNVGDWWSYRYTSRLEGVPDTHLTLVVADDLGSAWSLTSLEPANFTFFTHVPSLGPVRKSDLAVTRHGHFVPFLQFPLAEGATWQVEVRGLWTAVAHRAELDAGGQRVTGWRIEYREGDVLQHVIEWSPEVGWLVSELSYQGQKEPRHELRLASWGAGHAGPVRVYEADDVYVKGHFYDASQPQGSSGSEGFMVPSVGQSLLLGVFSGGTSGVCGHVFTAPAGSMESRGGAKACGSSSLEWAARPLVPGSWTSDWTVTGDASYVFVEVLLLRARDALTS